MLLERFGRSLIEAMRKQYDELRAKISETEVEKWTKLVDVECKHILSQTMSDLAYYRKVQRATRDDATSHNQMLTDAYMRLNKPIAQMSDHLSLIQDKFNSSCSFTLIFRQVILNPSQERSE